jgi:hypothetical protein
MPVDVTEGHSRMRFACPGYVAPCGPDKAESRSTGTSYGRIRDVPQNGPSVYVAPRSPDKAEGRIRGVLAVMLGGMRGALRAPSRM